MTDLEIKEIFSNDIDSKNSTKITFIDSKDEKEIILEGSGKIKIAVQS